MIEELGSRPEEEQIVLKNYHRFLSSLSKEKEKAGTECISLEELKRATINGELIIDKKITLPYPLNDKRTSPERRLLYLIQEEMMIAYTQFDREEAEEYEKISASSGVKQ
jgi:hypothetical protein